jgi:hypothetical protein
MVDMDAVVLVMVVMPIMDHHLIMAVSKMVLLQIRDRESGKVKSESVANE